ncbi:hypothetical protein AA313_de0201922 [Arthrobotrys entomopaga]|nr:hypothetical protein AA313_de0201922 [Arthrobotrys entomopaga]
MLDGKRWAGKERVVRRDTQAPQNICGEDIKIQLALLFFAWGCPNFDRFSKNIPQRDFEALHSFTKPGRIITLFQPVGELESENEVGERGMRHGVLACLFSFRQISRPVTRIQGGGIYSIYECWKCFDEFGVHFNFTSGNSFRFFQGRNSAGIR